MLVNSKLYSKEALISEIPINSVTRLDGFVLINNLLKEYNKMNNVIVLLLEVCRKNTENKNAKVEKRKNNAFIKL